MNSEKSRFGPFQLTREELNALHSKRPGYVIAKTGLILCLWVSFAFLAVHFSNWGRWGLLLVAGFFVNGLVQLVHDAWHENLFDRSWQNHLFGHLFSMIFPVLFRPARHAHMLHHKYNRTEKDPDAYNVGERSIFLVMQYYLVIVAGLPLAILHFNFLYPWHAFNRDEMREHLVHCIILMFIYCLIGWVINRYDLWNAVLNFWVLPLLFASPWNGLKSVADHFSNDWKGSRFRTATTVKSSSFVSFFWNGLNYHLDHHLFPRVPGYHLPKLHPLIKLTLIEKKSPVYDSYLHVWWGALRSGPVYTDKS